MSW
jgi:hypothetical protein